MFGLDLRSALIDSNLQDFTRFPGGVVEQLNSRVLKTDAAGFVELAEGLLEGPLADAKFSPYLLGRTVVVEGQLTAVLFEGCDDLIRQDGNALVTRSVEPQINLPIGTDSADKSFQFLADCERGG